MSETTDVVERFKRQFMQPGIVSVNQDADGITVVVATPLTALNLPSCFENFRVRALLPGATPQSVTECNELRTGTEPGSENWIG